MKCTLLGTSTAEGIPAPLCDCSYCKKLNRTRPSLLVETESTNILFDVSPDIRQQYHDTFTHIDAIFLTHHHHDHSTGLKELNHTTFSKDIIENESQPQLNNKIHSWLGQTYDLYCSKETKKFLDKSIGYIMNNNAINIKEVKDSEEIIIDNVKITPFIAEHSFGYMGYMIKDENKCVVYHPDYGRLNTEVKFDSIDYLVMDGSSYLGYNIHGTLSEFENLKEKINADRILFTNVSEHISQKNTALLKSLNKNFNNAIVDDGYVF